MYSYSTPHTNLEALLRDACRRAVNLGLSFTNQVRIYRSIVALAREVRLRAAGALFDSSNQALSALLAKVCEHASACGLDPELPLPDALLVQRLAVQLSRAARQANAAEPVARRSFPQHPLHREEPPNPAFSPQHPIHREDPTQPDTNAADSKQNPLHREEPPNPAFPSQDPVHREDPAQPDAHAADPKQHPIHREAAASDARPAGTPPRPLV